MPNEIFAGLSALKTCFDIVKGLKDAHDVTTVDRASVALLKELITAHEAHAAAMKRIDELEKELHRFETWESEKQRYELKALVRGGAAFAYVVKPGMQGGEPIHCICASCYQRAIKAILQFVRLAAVGAGEHILACPVCSAEVHTAGWPPTGL